MKKIFVFTLLCCLCVFSANAQKRSVKKSKDGICFNVDGNLPKPKGKIYLEKDSKLVKDLIGRYGEDPSERNTIGAKNIPAKYIASSCNGEKVAICLGKNAFFSMMVDAFVDHRSIELRPDDIWMVITQQFAEYVNQNAEELRDKFVEFKGKEVLEQYVAVDSFEDIKDWKSIIDNYYYLINGKTKADVASSLVADFSTTSSDMRCASEITLMKTLDHYFDYKLIIISCGIPTVRLEGTPEDWQKLYDKTMLLKKYGLDEYVDNLQPVLHQFVEASKGNVDRKFWQNIVMKDRPDMIGGGCGRQPKELNGWFRYFFLYNENKEKTRYFTVKTKLLESVTYAKVLCEDKISRQKFDLVFASGILSYRVNPKTDALSPVIGWFVFKAPEKKTRK